MKEKILEIIHGDSHIEPIILLDSKYSQLANESQKKEFLSILKDLALNGSEKEKFISLNTIEFLDKAEESEDEIKKCIEKLEFKESNKLISPLLTLCAMLSTNWSIDFINETLKHFKPKSNEYSYYFDLSLRSIVSTLYWRDYIHEIKWTMENYEDIYIVDFIAYFIWKQGPNEFNYLLNLIKNNKFLYDRIINLESEISNRYVNNYKKLDKSK